MTTHIPYNKLSKKEQQAYNAAQRNTWGGLDPVTRKPKSPKAYDRNKMKRQFGA